MILVDVVTKEDISVREKHVRETYYMLGIYNNIHNGF
jgi:hypothetical protein